MLNDGHWRGIPLQRRCLTMRQMVAVPQGWIVKERELIGQSFPEIFDEITLYSTSMNNEEVEVDVN